MNPENFLGEGQYGDVYKVKDKKSRKIYAAKFIKIPIEFRGSYEKLSQKRELE